jgi:hypothetical protein
VRDQHGLVRVAMSIDNLAKVVYMALERSRAGVMWVLNPCRRPWPFLPRFGFSSGVLLDMESEEVKPRAALLLIEGGVVY